ncbi:hypothetical protein GHK92_18115 [Nocardioides sp. dk4132]|uniref:calcium-binding protein n=1 Tax=unclassified Nocardioides TaxID=2615069 RepID=UPI0012958AA0|nr:MULTISPECIES: calcium-binding protein [unclassified Nocardioides]MQW77791.1 hypothetical protein [Nocardioides sp. dk4132]QGA08187.1 hypothetical protein GFH29_12820 [Nocardioides sp. dk884]
MPRRLTVPATRTRIRGRALGLLAAVTAGSVLVAVPGAAAADQVPTPTPPDGVGTAGPPYDYTTELMGQFPFIPLKEQARLTRTAHGYRYETGQQDNRITLRQHGNRIRITDTGTQRFKRLPGACKRIKVRRGVSASCRLPESSSRKPVLLEIWPRLGDDHVDASTLPASFAVTVLGDAGNDRVRFGAGDDFFNGHTGVDRVWGGGGRDWIRAGSGNDVIHGGDGRDQLIGQDGRDRLFGDAGDDRVGGDDGNDRLWGGSGRDFVLGGNGRDTVWTDGRDRLLTTEVVRRR